MKTLILSLLGALCLMLPAVAKADWFVGYTDDGCPVYYSPNVGFYQACYNYPVVNFGWYWNSYDWNYWRGNRGRYHGNHWRGDWQNRPRRQLRREVMHENRPVTNWRRGGVNRMRGYPNTRARYHTHGDR
jgi:hypothetical protein